MEELDQYIERVKRLPPAPRVLFELLNVIREPDLDASRVVDLISYDPGMTVQILQMCNSAYFALSQPVDSLDEAITRLGFSRIYQMAAAATAAETLGQTHEGYGMKNGELWKHSVAAGVAAQLLARRLGEDENVAFTAGLLHDIGKTLLSQALDNIYQKLLDESETQQTALVEMERKLLGVTHAEVGGRLLARWKLPASLVGAVWFHHQPRQAAAHERLASIVYLGNMIAYLMGHGYGYRAFAFRGRVEALEILELTPEVMPHYMIATFEHLKLVDALFRITPDSCLRLSAH